LPASSEGIAAAVLVVAICGVWTVAAVASPKHRKRPRCNAIFDTSALEKAVGISLEAPVVTPQKFKLPSGVTTFGSACTYDNTSSMQPLGDPFGQTLVTNSVRYDMSSKDWHVYVARVKQAAKNSTTTKIYTVKFAQGATGFYDAQDLADIGAPIQYRLFAWTKHHSELQLQIWNASRQQLASMVNGILTRDRAFL
jgi:hypothetical protein